LEKGWERYADRELDGNEPEYCDYFRRVKDGKVEVINHDPPMTPEALLARGVNLEKFSLI